MNSDTARGQAFTLEGFIGAMLILMAVLFAMQAAVITPSTGGAADRSVQAQTQQEAQDALVVANQDGNLSETLSRWDDDEFDGDELNRDFTRSYTTEEFENVSKLGAILNESFVDDGWSYTLEAHYPDSDGTDQYILVDNGEPPADAVTASHTVVLYDDQYVMPERQQTLEETADEAPIPREFDDDNPAYNTVEVRLLVW